MNFFARHLCDEQLLLGQLSARRLWKALSSILFVDQMHSKIKEVSPSSGLEWGKQLKK